REDTVMREAITAKTKLQIALCYLVTGASYRYLQAFYRVSRAAISSLIPEVMDAIFTYLENYLKISVKVRTDIARLAPRMVRLAYINLRHATAHVYVRTIRGARLTMYVATH
ncbi:hypothetical protein SFRURICE_018969, partial [Spodoptera frugiperda]